MLVLTHGPTSTSESLSCLTQVADDGETLLSVPRTVLGGRAAALLLFLFVCFARLWSLMSKGSG